VTITKKTDISGYSGGTVAEFHRVPFAKATTKSTAIMYRIGVIKSIFSLQAALFNPGNRSVAK